MNIDYSEPVSSGHFTLKCFPAEDSRQRVLSCETHITPQTAFSEGRDSFGNAMIYGAVKHPHSTFSVRVTGEVELLQTQYETLLTENEIFLYRHGGVLLRPDAGMQADYSSVSGLLPDNVPERAGFLMHRLYEDFHYEKGCTDANTDARTAFARRKGVCQDYSHIFIVLCRLAGIPARYVTGLLVGEGESHAWVEILHNDKWIGLDVTNNIPVTDSHIKFGHGRDAADCRINTGIVYGSAGQTQKVLAVTRLSEQ
ncbi:MAG: transglutaminase family protein [Oscillospiraceae bacterium]|nr:transglutaminase family protein [Oscillospiraceae bacterium]